ncbi:MAG: HD domain-containing phosphohydrolase, partial [Bdellovibrionota bacterium]
SVSFALIPTNVAISYDIFINSSALKTREHFIRISQSGDTLTKGDLHKFKMKYHQIYVAENQRAIFLKSACSMKGAPDEKKTTVLKESAIHHLKTLFENKQELTTEVLSHTIEGCRDVVDGMVNILGSYSIEKLQDLIARLSFHDFYTYDHSVNVAMYCILIYKAIFPYASHEEILQAGLGGLLHDLGKIKIPTHIINNAGKLSMKEFCEIKKHPVYGCELLKQPNLYVSENINLQLLNRVVMEHHENWDGTGYPKQLREDQIHILSRITAVADFFDAVTTKRSYHEPISTEDAIALMSHSQGKKLDPDLFLLFTEHIQKWKAAEHAQKHQDVELAPDFDPCQPHKELPLISSEKTSVKNGEDQQTSFGTVQVIKGENEMYHPHPFGKIHIIDPTKNKKNAPRKALKKTA